MGTEKVRQGKREERRKEKSERGQEKKLMERDWGKGKMIRERKGKLRKYRLRNDKKWREEER